MTEKDIDPESVIVRVEVADSYYDENVTADSISISDYTESPFEPGMYLVIFGGTN